MPSLSIVLFIFPVTGTAHIIRFYNIKKYKKTLREQLVSNNFYPGAQKIDSQRECTFRIGAVSYLNTKPLIHCLGDMLAESRLAGTQLLLDLPSRLASGLAAGALEVALIPSIEYCRQWGYSIVSDACVGCNGPVGSVKLYGRTTVSKIRTVALDEGSRTSAALTQILLAERFDIHPRFSTLPIGCSPGDSDSDAVMLIGDRGMIPVDGQFEFVWDLGQEWCGWTGLPFVFAMWICRNDLGNCRQDMEEVAQLLNVARDLGVERLEEIAEKEAPSLGLSAAECHDYLRNNLTYHLGSDEQKGLERFYQLAIQHGLIQKES